jgi:L-lactate dehydrogenase
VHGDSQVAAWSAATIGGSPIDKVLKPERAVSRAELELECRDRSRSIIRAKGTTPYGIGSAVTSICASILLNECSVRPVSHFQPDYGCCFSLPAILGREGIVSTIRPYLSSEEEAAIASSAKELRATVDRVLEHSH